MNILITGGTGMVGRNLFETAKNQGYKVFAPSSKELNLLSLTSTKAWFKKNNIDLLVHAAGIVGGIQANIRSQSLFLVQNSDMARNLFTVAFDNGVARAINLGSSCMYPKNTTNPLKEDQILNGKFEPTNEGYALGKIYAYKLCQFLSETKTVSYKTILPCNLFGKYDSYDDSRSHMIPAVIKKIHYAKIANLPSVEIWGDSKARREFMDVKDLTNCLIYAIDNFDTMPETMNVGTGIDYTIAEYYTLVAKMIGYEGIFTLDLTKPVGMKQKLVDVTIANLWGWQSKVLLLEGLKETYEFFRSSDLCQ
jgi:nucleoside-diphosphate-sugar epimerase